MTTSPGARHRGDSTDVLKGGHAPQVNLLGGPSGETVGNFRTGKDDR
jgi:hypothetical protein